MIFFLLYIYSNMLIIYVNETKSLFPNNFDNKMCNSEKNNLWAQMYINERKR